jgi:hypothetical protein
MIVFMTPALKSVPSIPFVSKYPAVSLVLIVVYIPLLFVFSKRYLSKTKDKAKEGFLFGVMLVGITALLDVLIYKFLFSGSDYYSYVSIWIAYALFIIIPWLTGKRLEKG